MRPDYEHACAMQAARERREADAMIEQLQADLNQRCFEVDHLQERLETCHSEYAHQVCITFHYIMECSHQPSSS